MGIETIAAALSEPRDAIEDIIEPYLLQQGFLRWDPNAAPAAPAAPAIAPAAPASSRKG